MLFCVINNPKLNNLFLIIEKHQNLVFEELEPAKEVQKKKRVLGHKSSLYLCNCCTSTSVFVSFHRFVCNDDKS